MSNKCSSVIQVFRCQLGSGLGQFLPAQYLVPFRRILFGLWQNHRCDECDQRANADKEEIVQVMDLKTLEQELAEQLNQKGGEYVCKCCRPDDDATMKFPINFAAFC